MKKHQTYIKTMDEVKARGKQHKQTKAKPLKNQMYHSFSKYYHEQLRMSEYLWRNVFELTKLTQTPLQNNPVK